MEWAQLAGVCLPKVSDSINTIVFWICTLNSLIYEQTWINEYEGKIFSSIKYMKNQSMVEIFLICYMKNWKYSGYFFTEKLSEHARFLGSSEY